ARRETESQKEPLYRGGAVEASLVHAQSSATRARPPPHSNRPQDSSPTGYGQAPSPALCSQSGNGLQPLPSRAARTARNPFISKFRAYRLACHLRWGGSVPPDQLVLSSSNGIGKRRSQANTGQAGMLCVTCCLYGDFLCGDS